jgi:hypothetical protein
VGSGLAILRTVALSAASVLSASERSTASRKRWSWGFSSGFGGSLRGMVVSHSTEGRQIELVFSFSHFRIKWPKCKLKLDQILLALPLLSSRQGRL